MGVDICVSFFGPTLVHAVYCRIAGRRRRSGNGRCARHDWLIQSVAHRRQSVAGIAALDLWGHKARTERRINTVSSKVKALLVGVAVVGADVVADDRLRF
jgi:hypothetical protein